MGKEIGTSIPSLSEALIFFDQKGFGVKDSKAFFTEYSERNWRGKKGISVKNWRAKALDWMWQRQKIHPYLRTRVKLIFK